MLFRSMYSRIGLTLRYFSSNGTLAKDGYKLLTNVFLPEDIASVRSIGKLILNFLDETKKLPHYEKDYLYFSGGIISTLSFLFLR